MIIVLGPDRVGESLFESYVNVDSIGQACISLASSRPSVRQSPAPNWQRITSVRPSVAYSCHLRAFIRSLRFDEQSASWNPMRLCVRVLNYT